MKEIKQTHIKPYGECSLCDWVGTIKYHHIIPKRYRIKTNKKVKLVFSNPEKDTLEYITHNRKIENLMIPVCLKCHKKLHPENWQYEKMEQLLKEAKKNEKQKADSI